MIPSLICEEAFAYFVHTFDFALLFETLLLFDFDYLEGFLKNLVID